MAKTLVVNSRIKELAQADGKKLNVSSDLQQALTEHLEGIIAIASMRAVANGRTTVMRKDVL